MKVTLVKEMEDGDGIFTFDMDEDETRAMLCLGIETAIKKGIEYAKELDAQELVALIAEGKDTEDGIDHEQLCGK